MSKSEMILSDMSQCQPGSALSERPQKGHWHLVDYDAGEVAGKMVFAQPLYETPEITLPLNVQGWYDSTDFWSPAQFRKWVMPQLKSDIEVTHQAGAIFIYQACTGYTAVTAASWRVGVRLLLGTRTRAGRTGYA